MLRFPRRAIVVMLGVLAVGALAAGTVAALTSVGSREISQSTDGVSGAAEPADFFSVAVAVGNFDGDRFADVVVAAPHEDRGSANPDAGVIQVMYGSRNGVRIAGNAVIHQGSPGVVGASRAGDQFGSALAVGNFDGDRYEDLVVGVAGKDIDGAVDAGEIVVLYGNGEGLSGARSARFGQDSDGVEGDPGAGDFFGHSVTTGDFNGDGFDDVAAGAPGDLDSGAEWGGSVTVFYGSEAGISTEGASLLHQGVALPDDGPAVLDDPEAGDRFGWSLTSGDFDDDGHDELAVGVPGESIGDLTNAGIAQVFNGSETGVTVEGNSLLSEATPGIRNLPQANDRFGSSLDSGDYDGNGASDLAIGVPGQPRRIHVSAGAIHVVHGAAGVGLQPSESVRFSQLNKPVPGRPGAGDEFGFSLVSADFNGNGRDDLAVGVPGEQVGTAFGAGTTHVFFGRLSGIDLRGNQEWRPGLNGLPGTPQVNAGFGRALAAGDLNGDGRDDLVAGTPGRTVSGRPSAGSFTIIPG